MATDQGQPADDAEAYRSETKRLEQTSRDAFFSFFDNASNADEAAIWGAWDFAVHVALPLAPYIDRPEEKTALEIGYGGGRLLIAASHFFGKAIGIDVHDCAETVAKELRAKGAGRFDLLRTDGSNIAVEDASVDVVYSFIVLQHVQYVEVLKSYFRETFRVLKPGGVAVLYCGRFCKYSRNTGSRFRYLLDRLYETAFIRRGYRQLSAELNRVNLIVTRRFGVNLARSIGFDSLSSFSSHRKVPDGYGTYGGQHGFVLRKP